MNYTVYVLYSYEFDKYYTGQTNNVKRRLEEHNRGENFSTSWRGPFKLVYYEAYKSLEDARERELALKFRGNSRKHLMNRLFNSLK